MWYYKTDVTHINKTINFKALTVTCKKCKQLNLIFNIYLKKSGNCRILLPISFGVKRGATKFQQVIVWVLITCPD